jgi:hypothetical protein
MRYKTSVVHVSYNLIVALLMVSALWLLPGQSEAMTVTELDFTGGSVALKRGTTTVLTSNFTINGQIVMGQYQPLPNIIAPIPLGPYTLSLFTGGPNPFPSSSTSGTTITADLNALFAKLTGPLLSPSGVSMNIGGNATGSFNTTTHAFSGLSWTHMLTGVSGLPSSWGNPSNLSLQFTLNGVTQLAAVPLPAAALLFLSGLSGLAIVRKRLAA